MNSDPQPESAVRKTLLAGLVIPAHPLALDAARKLDERRQVALTRYYCDAGAGGVAVGVHTTQFAIRDPKVGLLEPVLRLAHQTIGQRGATPGQRPLCVAGICGPTGQAIQEATLARQIGYDAGLVSLGALGQASTGELVEHCRQVAHILPLFGFYLQPAAGGRLLEYRFWREFLEIENVVAIKVAPFNRYQTLGVVRALAQSGRHGDVALYTGNDDNIVADLLTEFRLPCSSGSVALRFRGGLLGHWAVWTQRAVGLLKRVQQARPDGRATAELLACSGQVTDANAALFDAANGFRGCIAGLHEVLRRQGLLAGRWCLDHEEDLSPGQLEEIDRVYKSYPDLNDDDFVAENRDRWLG
ncbi:MAG: dihydrodipicolinate synthase family protein [Acidobacteriota bacterium]